MPGTKTIANLFSVIEIDMKKGEMTFAVPYMFRLFAILEEKNHVQKQTKQGLLYEYKHPTHNTLVHSSIASERNKTAVEIVYAITNGLLQRGFTPDSQLRQNKNAVYSEESKAHVTYTISYRGILNDCPMLRMRLHSYQEQKNRNNALQRAFKKAYELLENKTDAFLFFKNLRIVNKAIPTMNTLDNDIEFIHTGRNGNYKKRK